MNNNFINTDVTVLKDIYVVGAGGHAKVVISMIKVCGITPKGIFDDNERLIGKTILLFSGVNKLFWHRKSMLYGRLNRQRAVDHIPDAVAQAKPPSFKFCFRSVVVFC